MREILRKNRTEISVMGAFLALMTFFTIANPRVFLNYQAYAAVFISLPILIILTASLVFMVAGGEIDLSFPSIIGLGAWAFGAVVHAGGDPLLGLLASTAVGCAAGLLNGFLVAKIRLSSLVLTLGMNFFYRGIIMFGTQGHGISLAALRETLFHRLLAGTILGFPVQMIWGLVIAALAWLLFNRHRFGLHVCFIGDNAASAREMGVDVDRTRMLVFLLVGFASGLAAVFVCVNNLTFWPSAGDSYLLLVLAAVFLGGTPTWGGVGTIVGGVIGAFILGFMETGIIAAGFSTFSTQFFYGLILIAALVSHRLTGARQR